MGRQPSPRLSEIGLKISQQMRELGLKPGAVAAAAGVSPSTLYRIMTDGATGDPQLRTKRLLARALKTPMAQLFDEPQLEMLDEHNPPLDHPLEPLEQLVMQHLRIVDRPMQRRAAHAAALAIVDMILEVTGQGRSDDLTTLRGSQVEDRFKDLLRGLFRRLPHEVRRTGAKVAIRAMLDVEVAADHRPSEPMYRAINRTNWSELRILRDRPPLARGA